MNLEVPQAVKREAHLCSSNHSCLANGRCGSEETCKVEFAVGKKILFLAIPKKNGKPQQFKSSCAYRVSYGSREACLCPVHCYIEGVGLYKAG